MLAGKYGFGKSRILTAKTLNACRHSTDGLKAGRLSRRQFTTPPAHPPMQTAADTAQPYSTTSPSYRCGKTMTAHRRVHATDSETGEQFQTSPRRSSSTPPNLTTRSAAWPPPANTMMRQPGIHLCSTLLPARKHRRHGPAHQRRAALRHPVARPYRSARRTRQSKAPATSLCRTNRRSSSYWKLPPNTWPSAHPSHVLSVYVGIRPLVKAGGRKAAKDLHPLRDHTSTSTKLAC